MEQSVKCEACGGIATETYAAFGTRMDLCPTCLDQYEIQRAYQDRVDEIEGLSGEGNYDAALGILQELLDKYGHLDHIGVFRTAISAHEALILEFQGRLAEAAEKYRSILVLPNESERLLNRWSIARVLDKMGDVPGTIRELELGLDAATGAAIPTALTVLDKYASVLARENLEMPERYRRLFEDVANWWGLGAMNAVLAGGRSLTKAVLTAAAEEREAVKRFEGLCARLTELGAKRGDRQSVRKAIQDYVDTEGVGFYRRQAEAWLAEEEAI